MNRFYATSCILIITSLAVINPLSVDTSLDSQNLLVYSPAAAATPVECSIYWHEVYDRGMSDAEQARHFWAERQRILLEEVSPLIGKWGVFQLNEAELAEAYERMNEANRQHYDHYYQAIEARNRLRQREGCEELAEALNEEIGDVYDGE